MQPEQIAGIGSREDQADRRPEPAGRSRSIHRPGGGLAPPVGGGERSTQHTIEREHRQQHDAHDAGVGIVDRRDRCAGQRCGERQHQRSLGPAQGEQCRRQHRADGVVGCGQQDHEQHSRAPHEAVDLATEPARRRGDRCGPVPAARGRRRSRGWASTSAAPGGRPRSASIRPRVADSRSSQSWSKVTISTRLARSRIVAESREVRLRLATADKPSIHTNATRW